MTTYEYDAALSFAGEDRTFVEQVAEELERNNIHVFYDNYEISSLWGKDLYTHLDDIYSKKARYCIMFISSHYAKKLWTNHERQSAQARAFVDNQEYILPVKLDDTEIPGIRSTIGYIDGRIHSPLEIARMLAEKLDRPLSRPDSDQKESVQSSRYIPKLRTVQHFDKYQELLSLISYISGELDNEIPHLHQAGISVTKIRDLPTEKKYRFIHNGKLVYFIDFRLGGMMSSDSISFLDGWNEPFNSDNSATAIARIEWSQKAQQPIVKLTNFSLINYTNSDEFTKEEFFDEIWKKMCSTIESLS